MRRALPWLLLCLLALPARAQEAGPAIAAAIHDNRWADADALAATLPDPVASKLVLYYRLLSPGGGHPAEIAAFMADNPDWPNQALLSRRLQEALAIEGDDKTVLEICARQKVRDPPSMLRCADADTRAGRAPDAAEAARQAWINGIIDPPGETSFLRLWGKELTASDQWRRFDHLAWTDTGAVGGPAWRQIPRLDPTQRLAAQARLALRRDDPAARALLNAVPAAARAADPALMLEQAKWLRRAGQDDDAQRLWLSVGQAAEQAAPPDRRPAYWAERDLLARHRLREGDPSGAYALADQTTQTTTGPAADAHFLAGFIALRRLGDTDAAAHHFLALAALSKAAITQGRAFYWLGRTADARHDPVTARQAYAAAAAWPTTYYGQLAARAMGETDSDLAARIRAARDPVWDPARALDFAGRETARAAALLVEWGEPRRARAFLLRLDDLAPDPVGRVLAARLAAGFGMPDLAVAIARRAGQDGLMLPETGWPLAAAPPAGPVEPALALGLIRQESNFDTEAASPVGARGLMQLMPTTAQAVAKKLGEPSNLTALSTDPAYNMRLGTAYLAGLLDQFNGSVPYAVAGYNAGPSHISEWLANNGDPASGSVDIIDWIELIPFGETRNYVQRVIENLVIYRARTGHVLPHPLAHSLG
ncbi:MAG: lytic transglycosylase domain-containing protein [Acetobacteraceae bacterium]